MKDRRYFIAFILFLSACSPSSMSVISSPSPAGTELIPTFEKLPLPKNLPTIEPTETLMPSELPSLTTCESEYSLFYIKYADPLQPLDYSGSYDLKFLPDYSEIDADTLIDYMKTYPRSLGYEDRGYHDFGYFRSFLYIKLLQDDALFRFPESIYVSEWKWDRAFNIFMSDDNEMYEVYSNLILFGLNTEHITPDELSCWFLEHEHRLQLKLFSLGDEHVSMKGTYLAQISDSWEAAGIYFLIQRTGEVFLAHPLTYDRSVYLSSASGIRFDVLDFTGDNFPEIVTTHTYFPGSGDAITTYFNVFDVSSGIPVSLEFDPPIGTRRERTWQLVESKDYPPKFLLTKTFDRMTCPFTLSWVYQWDGEKIQLLSHESPTKDQIINSGGPRCVDIYIAGLLWDLHEGNLPVLEPLLEFSEGWPYSDSPWFPYEEGMPLDPSYLKFVIAVYLANLGEYQQSNDMLNSIISSSSPIVEISNLSSEFLDISSRDEFINACVRTDICYRYLDLEDDLLSSISPREVTDVVNFLRDIGVPIERSGDIDINKDGVDDKWVVLEAEEDGTYPEIWLILKSDDSFLRDELWQNFKDGPSSIISGPIYLGLPSIFASDADNTRVYVYDEPMDGYFLNLLCLVVGSHMDEIQERLYRSDPTELQLQLDELYTPIIEGCSSEMFDWYLPWWMYLDAVLNELIDEETSAIRSYLNIILEFPESPYALLAAGRLKIIP